MKGLKYRGQNEAFVRPHARSSADALVEARADENEACAAVCDELAGFSLDAEERLHYLLVAKRIRARMKSGE